MTVFNTATYLVESIESVLQQAASSPLELIVVDDGSTDGSLEIASGFAVRYPGMIHHLQHDGGGNRGISASRNLALSHATGTFIAFLDSDDVWLPHHLRTLLGVLRRTPEAAAVFAGAERWTRFSEPFDEAKAREAWWGENYLPPLVPAGEAAGLLPPGRLLQWFLRDESKVPCICSMVVRAEAARVIGGFVDEFRGLYDDQAFHAKLSLHFPLYAADVCVARYRRHDASCCTVARQDESISKAEQQRFLTFIKDYAGRVAEAALFAEEFVSLASGNNVRR